MLASSKFEMFDMLPSFILCTIHMQSSLRNCVFEKEAVEMRNILAVRYKNHLYVLDSVYTVPDPHGHDFKLNIVLRQVWLLHLRSYCSI